MRTVFRKLLVAMLAFGWLAGTAHAQTLPSPVVDGETIGTPDLVKAACAEGAVTYYTSQSDTDERAITAPFVKQFPCIKISIISLVTGRLHERVLSEAAAGHAQADLSMVTDEAIAQIWIDGKLTRHWTPPSAASYPDSAKLDGWWYAGAGTLVYPVYNTELVSASDAPKSWRDLLDPKWKGRIATSPINIGGPQWMQYDFMIEKLGADYLPKFVALEPRMYNSYNPAIMDVARGELAIVVTAALNEYSVRVGQGAPLKQVYPPEGVPFTNYALILFAGSPHPAAAELFGNWYLSKQGQAALVKQRGAYSARADVAPPQGHPPLETLHPWNPGRAAVLQQHDAVTDQVMKAFGGR